MRVRIIASSVCTILLLVIILIPNIVVAGITLPVLNIKVVQTDYGSISLGYRIIEIFTGMATRVELKPRVLVKSNVGENYYVISVKLQVRQTQHGTLGLRSSSESNDQGYEVDPKAQEELHDMRCRMVMQIGVMGGVMAMILAPLKWTIWTPVLVSLGFVAVIASIVISLWLDGLYEPYRGEAIGPGESIWQLWEYPREGAYRVSEVRASLTVGWAYFPARGEVFMIEIIAEVRWGHPRVDYYEWVGEVHYLDHVATTIVTDYLVLAH